MSEDPTETILDSARYLANIRPIDPEELIDYVASPISPEEVRNVLRDHATEIGLIERSDGIFEAAKDDPVEVEFDGVARLPHRIDRAIESRLVESSGDQWASGESGHRLRTAIRSFKRRYFAGEAVTYDRITALGYAIYHLPASFASIQYVVDELRVARLLSSSLRVLDVGAGVGGQALGLDAYLPDSTLIEYTAVESSEAMVAILGDMLEETGRNFHWRIRSRHIEQLTESGPFDLILCSNVLNELDTPVAAVEMLSRLLADDGSIIAIEPADEQTSRGLRRIEHRIVSTTDVTVFSPTIRLWPGHEPTDDCWSFRVHPDIETPTVQREIDERPRAAANDRAPASGEFRNVDVQYSYAILRTDERRRIDYRVSGSSAIPLNSATDHVTNRVDVAVVKLSHSLSQSTDSNPLYVVGDGSQDVEWFAVLTARSHGNHLLEAASYGDVLLLSNALVLWNDDEAAYNLVVDNRCIVDRVTPTGVELA